MLALANFRMTKFLFTAAFLIHPGLTLPSLQLALISCLLALISPVSTFFIVFASRPTAVYYSLINKTSSIIYVILCLQYTFDTITITADDLTPVPTDMGICFAFNVGESLTKSKVLSKICAAKLLYFLSYK